MEGEIEKREEEEKEGKERVREMRGESIQEKKKDIEWE